MWGRERGISFSKKYWFVFSIVELIIELRIQRPWDNDLEDKKSEAFKLLSDLLKDEVRLISSMFGRPETLLSRHFPETLLSPFRTQMPDNFS